MTALFVRSFSVFFLFFILIVSGQTTQAQTSFTVTNTNDAGAGSLRQALDNIGLSADPGPFTVTFGLSGTINLSSGLVAPTKNVLLVGPSSTTTAITLRGGGPSSDFSILTVPASATLVARYLAFTEGRTTSNGGAIKLNGGILQLAYCYLFGNSANNFGGAVHQSTGSFTITNSTFASNTAVSNSGALHKAGSAPGLIDNCTFSGNVGRAGGAIEAAIGSLTINNSTFTQNRALGNPSPTGAEGGAIYGGNGSNRVTLNNCLIAGNTTLGTGPDLIAGFNSDTGHNLIGINLGPTLDAVTTGNVTGIAAASILLPTLANNGGPTPTHPIQSAGAAYNAGPAASTGADQRGLAVFGGRRDIGAFESQILPLTATVGSISAVCGGTGGFSLTVSGGTGSGYQYRLTNAESLSALPTNPYTVSVTAGNFFYLWVVDDAGNTIITPIGVSVAETVAAPTVSGTAGCPGSSTLSASCTRGTPLWSTGETTEIIVVPTTAAVYSVACLYQYCTSESRSLTVSPTASLTVTSTADSGPGTLRQAILDMNALVACEPFLITIDTPGPVSLTAALPELLKSVTITSANALTPATATGGSTIERATGSPDFRLFLARTSGKILTLRYLILQRGVGIAGLGGFRGGGAIVTDNGVALTMERCLVQSCSAVAQYDGAGIHAVNGPLTLTDCEFRDNQTGNNGYGGAIRTGLLSLGNPSPTRLERCTFLRNGTDKGGAVYLNSVAQLINCTFDGNVSSATDEGAAIFVQGGRSVSVVHGTFRNHTSGTVVIRAPGDREMVLQNNLFAQNPIPHFSGLYTSLGGNVSDKPDAATLTQATDRVNVAVSLSAAAANGGLVQTSELPGVCSNPAIDSGVVTSLTADARGIAYVGLPDAGAYESSAVCVTGCQPVLHVTESGSGVQDGSSWANSLPGTQLQTAIDRAASCGGGAVWVARGLYKPTSTTGFASRSVSFSMANNVRIYGGFAGISSETALSNRPPIDPTTGQPGSTTLSGEIGAAGIADNSFHIMYNPASLSLTNSAVLDGFVLANGNANFGGFNGLGAGMYNEGNGSTCNPTVRNCSFVANKATTKGAGMYNTANGGSCSPILTNCVFSQNETDNYGSGMLNLAEATGVCSPTLTNCLFTRSSSGAISNQSNIGGICSPVLTNCTFRLNTSNNGGTMYNFTNGGTCSPTVTNCQFIENRAITQGIFHSTTDFALTGQSHPVLTNCVFQSNTTGAGGGSVLNLWGAVADLINCSFGGNRTTSTADGRVVSTDAPMSITNCAFWDNGPVANPFAGPISAEYSLFPVGSTTGITTTNCLTVSVSPFSSTTSTELLACSPAINAGDPTTTSATVGIMDVAGNARFFNGGRVDMGAYEFAGEGLPTSFSVLGSGTITCASSPTITLSGSETGVSYQLQRDGVSLGSLRTGTGATLSFGPQSLSGVYTILATHATSSCTLIMAQSASVMSNTAPPTVSIAPTSGTLTCAAPSRTLTASTSGTGVRWNTGETTPSIVVSTSGTYSVTATAANGCTNTTNVTINTDLAGASAAPTLSASSSVVCAGATVQVVATVGGSPPFQWYKDGQPTGQTSATLTLGGAQQTQAGSYVLVIAGACSVTSAPFNLTVNPLPTATILVPQGSMVNGPGTGTATITLPAPLTGVAMQVLGGISFERLIVLDRINGFEIRQVDQNTNGIFNVNRTGPFRLTVTDAIGCKRIVDGVVQIP